MELSCHGLAIKKGTCCIVPACMLQTAGFGTQQAETHLWKDGVGKEHHGVMEAGNAVSHERMREQLRYKGGTSGRMERLRLGPSTGHAKKPKS